MTFPPSLTWMHLLPQDASFEPLGRSSSPVVERLVGLPRSGGPCFDVADNIDVSDWARDHTGSGGLVAINCGRLDPDVFALHGFNYVRGFAAVPNLANARWFIPLDSPRVSSAAFRIYSPTRLSARLKRSAVQLLARSGVPVWYRDQVWVVQKDRPAIERLVADALPAAPVRLALSAGAPEPARNRKVSAALVGLDGRLQGFAKISGSPLAHRLLEHEASFLSHLATNQAVRNSVPRLIAAESINDRFVLLQSPVTGSAASAQMTAAHRHFLAALTTPDRKAATATSLVAGLINRLHAQPDLNDALRPTLLRTATTLAGVTVPTTAVHGDFAPWNIRQRSDSLCCYDWEYGHADALPAVDETHHELQVGYLLKDWSVDQADDRLTQLTTTHPGFTPAAVSAFQNVYLLDILLRLAEEGYSSDDPMIHWTRRVLARRSQPMNERGIAA